LKTPRPISLAGGINSCFEVSNGSAAKERDIRTEEELVAAAREGDQDAFKELLRRNESRIAVTVKGMLGDCPEAEDVAQDTFLRFYRSLGSFRGGSSVGTYLTRIAINLSLNELKRRSRRLKLFVQDDSRLESLGDDPKSTGMHGEIEGAVRRAVQALSPEHRSVVVLRLMDGYSTKETSEILGIPLGTVLSRLARAQKKLRSVLSPYLEELR